MPRGYVGNPETAEFHRLECPRVEAINPAVRQYFAVYYDALNARYHPCEHCEPMSGWR